MIFTSFEFALFFLVLLVLLRCIRNDSARRWILLLASYFFYGYWNAWYLLLMAAVTLWSWLCGLRIAAHPQQQKKRQWLTVGVVLSLSALAIFKYSGFFFANVSLLTGLPVPKLVRNLLLPVGISFYTFHSISYYVDVYRGHVAPARSLREYALYISFFPQLVAGPIVRASQFLPQLDRPIAFHASDFLLGSRLFLAGAVQKLLLADTVSPFVDQVFASPSLYSCLTNWLAVAAYGIQIFGDFSGYTLMAIGLARILGFELPENFRMPYLSRSVTEFWQRWHISLSRFLRDYLYFSLGGNRCGFVRSLLNVMVTMLLGGLWHGASWNFVLWGALHGIAIVVHRLWLRFVAERLGNTPAVLLCRSFFGWAVTLLFVLLAWIPFRAPSFAGTAAMLHQLVSPGDGIAWYHIPTLVVLAAAVLWHLWSKLQPREKLSALLGDGRLVTFEMAAMATLLLLFAPVSTSPFIYFQF